MYGICTDYSTIYTHFIMYTIIIIANTLQLILFYYTQFFFEYNTYFPELNRYEQSRAQPTAL